MISDRIQSGSLGSVFSPLWNGKSLAIALSVQEFVCGTLIYGNKKVTTHPLLTILVRSEHLPPEDDLSLFPVECCILQQASKPLDLRLLWRVTDMIYRGPHSSLSFPDKLNTFSSLALTADVISLTYTSMKIDATGHCSSPSLDIFPSPIESYRVYSCEHSVQFCSCSGCHDS